MLSWPPSVRVFVSSEATDMRCGFDRLAANCKLAEIDPFAYLRDVLDRISTHPNARIGELTPRGWKAALTTSAN